MGTDNANKDRQAIDLLFAERCSCVVRNGDTIRIFRERGVRDLWRLLHEEPELLDGAFVADKVVGKGAAALMAAGLARWARRPRNARRPLAGMAVRWAVFAACVGVCIALEFAIDKSPVLPIWAAYCVMGICCVGLGWAAYQVALKE